MKKVGYVMAFRRGHNNYGTSLQGYALLKKMQQLGYEVEIIDYVRCLTIWQKLRFVLNAVRAGEMKNIIKRLGAKRVLNKFPHYADGIKIRTEAVNRYKEKKLVPLFRTYVGYNELHNGSKNYSIVLVGSDQVWTPMSLPNKYFNLLFVDDRVPKVAYASSFGVSEIPHFQRKATGAYLDRFSAIGVREQRGKEIVDSLSHRTAQVVADPTLLLSRQEWEEELKDSTICETSPYIFCYFLGTNKEARASAIRLKEKTGYKIITIRHMDEYVPEDESFGDEAPYEVGPNDFIKYISQATYVCTDSFHCTVFSILFHKQFMTFYRFAQSSKIGRNSRIDSLFHLLNISREHIYEYGDIIGNIDSRIEWNKVEQKLENIREESINFLQRALSLTIQSQMSSSFSKQQKNYGDKG